MPQPKFIVYLGLMGLIAGGCVELPSKQVLYEDSEVKVVKHKLPVIMADGGPTYFEFSGSGHTFRIPAELSYLPDSFARTPDGDAMVFMARNLWPEEQAGIVRGAVHVVHLKSESDITVPFVIDWKGDFNPHVIVKSYDGKKTELFLDSANGADRGGNLEIDLNSRQVTKFDRTNDSVVKPATTR